MTVYETLVNHTGTFPDLVKYLNDPAHVALKTLLNDTNQITTIFAPQTFDNTTTIGDFNYLLHNNTLVSGFSAGQLVSTFYNSTTGGFPQQAKFSDNTTLQGATIGNHYAADNGVVYVADKALSIPSETNLDIINKTAATTNALIKKANLTDALAGTFSVFAPTDDAWSNDTRAVIKYLQGAYAGADLANALKDHVVTPLYYKYINGNATVKTLADRDVTITVTPSAATFGTGKISSADNLANNGDSFLIDTVQTGSVFFSAGKYLSTLSDYSNFYKALVKQAFFADYLDGTKQATFLAPSNDKLKTDNVSLDVLQYHVLPGTINLNVSGYYPTTLSLASLGNKSQPIMATHSDDGRIKVGNEEETAHAVQVGDSEIATAGGALYTIDDVLEIPEDDVSEIIADEFEEFNELVKLLPDNSTFKKKLAGSDFTIFAPTDDVVQSIPKPYRNILTNPNDTSFLEIALNYHGTDGTMFAEDLKNNSVLTMFDARHVTISRMGSVVTLDGEVSDANVVEANMLSTNGVVHGLDNILVPSTFVIDAMELIEVGLGAHTFTDLLNTSGLLNDTTYNLTKGGYVYFVPTDDAFDNLKDKDVITTNDTEELMDLLMDHISADARLFTKGLVNETCYDTLNKNGTLCAYCDKNYENWYVTLNKTDIDVDIDAPEPEGKNTSTNLMGYSTLSVPKVSYVYSLDGVLGEKEKKKNKGLGSTEIGLIVAGCIVAVLLAGAAVGGAVWYYRKNSNKDHYTEIAGGV
eukprot:CAMPEP_0174252338 /NCGR_PEP_ID=MMETSP0439-20130205/1840_1 /TAXON_ID=0 /ORGANISM="Stereomyxa ramosa, Strain Chinc5" /LENGTH=752 /DNA_ID=CAMNT_0015332859 /DNA_START=154 /DNA_END=2412 /DNA_ORIENTATION=-